MSRILCRYSWEEYEKIKEYIANQLKEDKLNDQMTIEEIDYFKG